MVNSRTFVGRARAHRKPIPQRFGCPEGSGRLRRFRGGGRFCDQLSGWFCGLGLIPPVRWGRTDHGRD